MRRGTFYRTSVFSALGLGLAAPSVAQETDDLADRFGARPAILDISLSPDGKKLGVVVPYQVDDEALITIDLENGAKRTTAALNTEPHTDLRWCDWATNSRLICRVTGFNRFEGNILGYNRLLALNADGSEPQSLSPPAGPRALGVDQHGGSVLAWSVPGEKPGKILMAREYIPEMTTGTHTASTEEGLGVDEVDISSLRRRRVEGARADAVDYIADEKGRVRMVRERVTANGLLTDRTRYQYRPAEGGSMRTLQFNDSFPEDFEPLAVNSADNVVLGIGTHDGFGALYSVTLDEAANGTLLLAKSDADIDTLLRVGNGGRVVGASYATEKREVQFFDPQLKALAGSLHKALPGLPLIQIVDASDDENEMLLIAGSDTDPGMVYLFHKKEKRLEEVLPLRPELSTVDMGKMTPVTFPASDGTMIPGYLTLPPGSDGKNLPAIVMPHGGPSARDEWGFDWLVEYFAHRGFAVLQPNFRGSSGYGSEWFQKNGFQSWPTAIGDVNDAGRWLVSQGIANAGELSVVGWSYGGYAALQSAVVDPQLYKAIVAIAPVTDLDQLRSEARGFTNQRLVSEFIGTGNHVEAGSPARHADRFAAPVLLFHGDFDTNVDVGHSRRMAKELEKAGKSVTYVELKDLDHRLDRKDARSEMLTQIDSFLRQSWAK